MSKGMSTLVAFMGALALSASPTSAETQSIATVDVEQRSSILARNAKQLCSVIFVVGRTPEEAMAVGDVVRWERLLSWWDWSEIDIRVDMEGKRVT